MCKKKLLIYLLVFSLCVALVCFTPLIASADSFDISPTIGSIDLWANGDIVSSTQVTNSYAPNFVYLQSSSNIATSDAYIAILLVTARNGGLIKDGYWNRFTATIWIRTNYVNIGTTPYGRIEIPGAINTQVINGVVSDTTKISGNFTGFDVTFEWTNHNDNGDTLSDAVLVLGAIYPNAYAKQIQIGYELGNWLSASSMAEAPIYPSQDGNNQELDDLENKEGELWQNNEDGLQAGLEHILGLNVSLNAYASCFAAITDITAMALGNIPILSILLNVSIGFGVFAMLLGLYGIVYNKASHDYSMSKSDARRSKAKQDISREARRSIIDSTVED